ncbi:four-carbon acid sugar kinase family protein, partial [Herbaspirillum frisingense]|uniref:four-carbon acid sugar kinase family protein n=1 Tax=Herbaspirillum frisingense TaxID=92645 RepID=UPI0039AEC090
MTLAAAAVATVADRARLLIVGDDLSGTADCAVTCTHFGLDSVVALGADADAALQAVDVLALDADTRGLPPGDAARLNAAAWQAHSDGRRLYKKIDSTLRGIGIGAPCPHTGQPE